MKTGWNNKTPTSVLIEAYDGKSDILRTWEKESAEVQAENREEILDLTKRLRIIRNYITHRKDSPL